MSKHKENLDSIKTFLQSTIAAWKDMPIAQYNELILTEGEVFSEVVPSDKIDVMKAWRKSHKPKIKECFYNSQMFVVSGGGGRYFEGYCFDGLIPFHHAWVVFNGKVVDFTLEARDRSLKRQKIENNAANAVYLGVSVPRHVIMENIVKTGVAEPIAQKHYLKSEMRFL